MKDITAKTVATILIDEWFCKYGIPNQILTDQGTQFQSKLLDIIYEYFDVKKLKTTPFHPQCDGQSERSVQTVKTMIKSYIDEDQLTWDENLSKYSFAYNTSEHEATKFTPFELMFGRKPKIPIDILIPNFNNFNREPILQKFTLINEHGEVDVLADPVDAIEKNLTIVAQEYMKELKNSMKNSFKVATRNRNLKMNRAKIDHDRKIHKFEYKIGDLVLVDHPELKKGLSSGIARKFYGPFEVVGKNRNKVDYFIKKYGSKKARTKQVHISRLKTFYYNLGDFGEGKNAPNHDKTKDNLSTIKQEPVKNVKTPEPEKYIA
ncbi:unnamed protein product [Brachionus calyciflorus]|uniref:Integrase catalytic domain-containing protein n=1 Tax=Brachionus calyciflorus TaxID=104777 RepID=A0A814NSI3_9BILA|nr:unnamed protein product [Brachionus calyciflorus]